MTWSLRETSHGRTVAGAAVGRRPSRQGLLVAAGNTFRLIGLLTLILGWAVVVGGLLHSLGLFNWIGTDWGMYWGATRAFIDGGAAAAYDLRVIAHTVAPLQAYYGPAARQLVVGPSPYPPVFFAMFAPWTLASPGVSFVLWTAMNVALGVYTIARLAARLPQRSWVLVPTVLLSFPVAYGIFVGQLTVLFMFAMWRAYLALERGQETRAGLWIGVLLFKPQFAAVLILVFLLKRRWDAIKGVAIAGTAIGASSFLVMGVGGVRAILELLRNSYSGFSSVQATVKPEHMVSWRGFLLNVLPGVHPSVGLILTGVLSVGTIALLPIFWRGQWNPHDDRFASRMFATLIVTLLVGYHVHLHGASLLVVPGMIMASQRQCPRVVKWLMGISLYLLAPVFFVTLWVPTVSVIFVLQMLIALSAIVRQELNRDKATPGVVREPSALSAAVVEAVD